MPDGRRFPRTRLTRAFCRCALAPVLAARCLVAVSRAQAAVLRVGSYHGIQGQYSSIQDAVNNAAAGDWVLVGPGDYKETGNTVPAGASGDDRAGAAVSCAPRCTSAA